MSAKKASNPHRKEFRTQCWARGRERKAARRQTQENAARINREVGFTRWDLAKKERTARRARKERA